MKLLITGSGLFGMLRPHLSKHGVDSVLVCTYRVPDGDTLAQADRGYHLAKDDGPGRLVDIAVAEGVSAALSTSMPEDMNLRDAMAADELRARGIKFVVQPQQFITLCRDKHACKRFLERRGYPTASGHRVSRLREAEDAARELGYPVMCKPAGRWAGQGISVVADRHGLASYFLSAEHGDVTVEEFLDGEEFSVETVTYPGWSLALAPVYKGRTSLSGSHAMEHVRIAPYPERQLQRLALDMARDMGSRGPAEFEFIRMPGGPKLIEVNPRFSGVTRMAVTGSGFNTPVALADLALDRWDVARYVERAKLSVELPVMATDTLPEEWPGVVRSCPAVSRTIVLAVGATVGRVEFVGTAEDIASGARAVHEQLRGNLGQLDSLFESLGTAADYLRGGGLCVMEGVRPSCRDRGTGG